MALTRSLRRAPPKEERKMASQARRRKAALDPKAAGLRPKVLKEYEHEMRRMVKMHCMPGFASVVMRHGEIVHTMTHGYADLETKQPYRMDTLCRLFCATKSYVATAFMMLVEAGKVSLEDRLDKFLPSFRHARVQPGGTGRLVKPKEPIKMKHILSHTSGIGYPPDLGEEAEDDIARGYAKLQHAVQKGSVRSLREFVDRLAKVPLMNHPGETYEYGFSMDVVARVIEVIERKDIEVCLQERVFEPLGMFDTMWYVPTSELGRLAACYAGPNTWGNLYGHMKRKAPTASAPGLLRIDGEEAAQSGWRAGRHCKVKSGGGFMGYLCSGLVGTPADSVKFVQFVVKRGLGPDGQRLLSEKSLAIMEKNRLKAAWGKGKACYIGNVGVFREGGKEFGMGGAACTYWSVDRADGVETVWFTQHVDMQDIGDITGVKHNRADLWRAMHDAVRSSVAKGGRRKRKASSSRSSTKRSRSGKST